MCGTVGVNEVFCRFVMETFDYVIASFLIYRK